MRPIAVTSVNHFTFALALLAVGVSAPAHTETLNCTAILSLPATIATQGLFCLTGNLATARTSGNAITITANNVTLDLNGFKLGGQAAGSATLAAGIRSLGRNTTVKNGIVRGFDTGIHLLGRGAVIEDLLVDQNTRVGIVTTGPAAVVRRNQVIDTGGKSVGGNVDAVGIEATSDDGLIEHNVVAGLSAAGAGDEIGIRVTQGADNTLVRANFVTDTAKPTGGGTSRGIELQAPFVNVSDNTVSNMTTCILYRLAGTGLFSGNTVTACDTHFSGGTEGQQGNNFIAVP